MFRRAVCNADFLLEYVQFYSFIDIRYDWYFILSLFKILLKKKIIFEYRKESYGFDEIDSGNSSEDSSTDPI